jgi:hypothetical protein
MPTPDVATAVVGTVAMGAVVVASTLALVVVPAMFVAVVAIYQRFASGGTQLTSSTASPLPPSSTASPFPPSSTACLRHPLLERNGDRSSGATAQARVLAVRSMCGNSGGSAQHQHSTILPPPTQHRTASHQQSTSAGDLQIEQASSERCSSQRPSLAAIPCQHARRSFWALPAGGACPHCCCCWVHCCCSAVCGGGGWGAAACCWYCHCCFPSAYHPTIV